MTQLRRPESLSVQSSINGVYASQSNALLSSYPWQLSQTVCSQVTDGSWDERFAVKSPMVAGSTALLTSHPLQLGQTLCCQVTFGSWSKARVLASQLGAARVH